ncbi:MAG: hypothetical protein PVG65_07030 [Candidatus Thorarchaeota archaeon]|jgi:hypothetical protein
MKQDVYESDIHLLEKKYNRGYRIKYISYLRNRGPIFQVQKRLFGFLWYRPCKKENGRIANFLGLDKTLPFIEKDFKNDEKRI